MPVYEIKSEDENTKATKLVKEKLGFDVKVEINKETGIATITSENLLLDEDVIRIGELLKEYGYIS
jgi:hypothetical protein